MDTESLLLDLLAELPNGDINTIRRTLETLLMVSIEHHKRQDALYKALREFAPWPAIERLDEVFKEN